MLKKTKIVATVSDKRCGPEFIEQLYKAGMNVVRLNTAHQDFEASLKVIKNVRQVSDKIALLLDTKGPEIRTTNSASSVEVKKGATVLIKGAPGEESRDGTICVTHKDIAGDVPAGSCVLIDDGEIELIVVGIKDNMLMCEVKNNGIVKPRKSVNIPNAHINLPSLSKKDIEYIDFAIENKLDFIAHSFVRTREDVKAVRDILDKKKSNIKIIAKIENQQGVDNIDSIMDYAYGIMVARGDLGIEIAAEKIPGIQRRIISKCLQNKKPVIIATQMLHTMINNPRPTRAEVSDVANAIYSRTDAIMLSGETAYGDYPIEAVGLMTKIAQEVEQHLSPEVELNIVRINNEVTATLAKAAVRATLQLPVKAVVIDTLTGRTGRYLSAFRGDKIVYAKCYNKSVMRQMALSYGIVADYMEPRNTRDEFVKEALTSLLNENRFKKEDMVLVIGGSFGPANGASFMEISKVKNMIGEL